VAGDFLARTEALKKLVGDGDLSAIFGVDGGERTVPLEVGGWKTGPNAGVRMENFTTPGTGPHAAQQAFEANYEATLEDAAKTLLVTGPQEAFKRHLERVDAQFKKRAPMVTGQYRDSTVRIVTDDGFPVYERRGAHYGEEPA
jgi:hypothetical protein